MIWDVEVTEIAAKGRQSSGVLRRSHSDLQRNGSGYGESKLEVYCVDF